VKAASEDGTRPLRPALVALVGLAVAVFVFVLYVRTLAPTVLYYDRPILLDSAMLQVQAITLGIPGGTEFGARGAAILAGVGTGVFPSFEVAMAAFVRADRSFAPRPDVAESYTALYELYRHLYQNARGAWALRQQVLSRLERD